MTVCQILNNIVSYKQETRFSKYFGQIINSLEKRGLTHNFTQENIYHLKSLLFKNPVIKTACVWLYSLQKKLLVKRPTR